MKRIIFSTLILFTCVIVNAQINPKKTNFYYDTQISENEGIILSAKNPVSKYNYSKFGLIINNKTENFVYFVAEESKLKVNGKEYNANKKRLKICRPGKKIVPTLKFEGSKEFLADEMTFIPGGLYTFDSNGTPVNVEDFKLPPSKNYIDQKPFKIQMKKLSKETKLTAVKFNVTYTGDKVGLVSMSKAAVRTPDGNLWANSRTKQMSNVILKGETKSYTLYFEVPAKEFDMQFTELFIVWGETFSEAKLKPVFFDEGKISIDSNTTKKKNK